jgi:hypothetical protein
MENFRTQIISEWKEIPVRKVCRLNYAASEFAHKLAIFLFADVSSLSLTRHACTQRKLQIIYLKTKSNENCYAFYYKICFLFLFFIYLTTSHRLSHLHHHEFNFDKHPIEKKTRLNNK